MAITLGQDYDLYWMLNATAPTDAADETQGTYAAIGEINGTISISRSRAVAERRQRDNPNARYVHPGDRTETITFEVNLDLTDNATYQDLQAAYNSDTDGVGATGSLGYFNITDTTAGNLQWYGTAGVSDLSVAVTRADAVVTVSVTLEVNNDITEGVHA